jgi:hypothetical protein
VLHFAVRSVLLLDRAAAVNKRVEAFESSAWNDLEHVDVADEQPAESAQSVPMQQSQRPVWDARRPLLVARCGRLAGAAVAAGFASMR